MAVSHWKTVFQVSPVGGLPQPTCVEESSAYDAGYVSRGRDRASERHVIFHYCLEGRGECWLGAKRYEVPRYSGFLHVINDAEAGYGYPRLGRGEYRFLWVGFAGESVRECCRGLIAQYGPVYALPLSHFLIQRLLAYRKDDANILRLTPGEGAQLVWTLLAQCALAVETRTPVSPGEAVVVRARQIVECRGARLPSAKELAGLVGVSREHLSRIFREHTGETLGNYLRRRGIVGACRLLKQTDLPLAEIAFRAGYATPASFARAFRQAMGSSPGVFRRQGIMPIE